MFNQWTTEKVKAESVNVLPKAYVEAAILEDDEVALTLNDGQKVNSYFNPNFGGYRVNTELDARSTVWLWLKLDQQ
ncbi:hypothetical protein DAPPUDRAFT_316963 [Daphnia pulex]|uniref:Uncharacterized protein n=1 Tax=Daphnia pulex TaxID=6669 RepID=E9GEH8_DAPPU|nr:hypothetical protein DAPPUDRAFT_316963 [Daphnia pulex]|eukprot:EFX82270.1 hypothetical protein DAPPUDRAFT_316963 [Daphnia pulex]